MKKIKVTLAPNIESDIQVVDLSDMNTTIEEWELMNEDDKNSLLSNVVVDNIYGMIDRHEIIS